MDDKLHSAMRYLHWSIAMDTSREGCAYRATWRDGASAITHYFVNFVGMIHYLAMVGRRSFSEHWSRQSQICDIIHH